MAAMTDRAQPRTPTTEAGRTHESWVKRAMGASRESAERVRAAILAIEAEARAEGRQQAADAAIERFDPDGSYDGWGVRAQIAARVAGLNASEHAEGWPDSCPTCRRAFGTESPAEPVERGEEGS